MSSASAGRPQVLSPWAAETAQLWGQVPLRLNHNLAASKLFSREALAELIETYPRSHYALVNMGDQQDKRLWREGDIGGLRGTQVLDAIERGRMWLNLREVSKLDARYSQFLDQMFEELEQRLPGFVAPRRNSGILISSPRAQVYYHADLPGQALFQIEGRKRLYVYPAVAPFITPEHLEDIALFDMELDVPYADWYDRHAQVIDLEPGSFATWPLNAPHRVENFDCLNVSMTVSFLTEAIRRAQRLNLANGILRHRFGLQRPARRLDGVSYWSKVALQKALRDTRWVKAERAARRPITFKLDPSMPGSVRELRPMLDAAE
jgi:hypothetical protein